ncbi:plexin-B-like [Babylonia areolata]|uniref:plexin-B-like n=1 Tax=Babylonia areolata TaxID=304850 RepID=UPI003FD46A57
MEEGGLSHVVVDGESGAVYVGGRDRVHELSPELQPVQTAVTGPCTDSPDCLPPTHQASCPFPRRPTHNHNKLLVLVPRLRLLVTCGSVYQGACETRPLLNLSHPKTYYTAEDVTNFAVAANSPQASTVGFVAPGVGVGGVAEEVLYVAVTYTGSSRSSGLYRDQVPAISSRSLRPQHRFCLASLTSPLRGRSSSIFLKSKVRAAYPIRYVTGFSDSGFSYFLSVQRASDVNFFSYTDVPLLCRNHHRADYNILEAARIISPGKRLREALGIGEQEGEEKVMVAAFSRKEEGAGGGGGGGGGRMHSALCVYRMSQVRARILDNVKLCHHGNTSVSGGGYLRVGPRGNCNRQSVRSTLQQSCRTAPSGVGTSAGLPLVVWEPVEDCLVVWEPVQDCP